MYGRSRTTTLVEGGDVLLLSPGVLAVGVGQRTTPGGRREARPRLFAAGLAHTVLAVPIAQDRATMHLDTVCTMVDADAVVMYPGVAHTLVALTRHAGTAASTGPRAVPGRRGGAMGIDRLRVIDTGLDPVTAEREQWDDGNNTLALRPGSPSPTSATARPTPGSRRRHRGGARSRAASWAPAAAARAACPARCCATRVWSWTFQEPNASSASFIAAFAFGIPA